MKIVVSYEFDSQEEAAKFLTGGSTKGGKKGGKKAQVEDASEPQTEAAADAKTLSDEDYKSLLGRVAEAVKAVTKKPNPEENKAHLVNLIAKHGGDGKASTVPRENFEKFTAAVEAFNESLAESQEESLI